MFLDMIMTTYAHDDVKYIVIHIYGRRMVEISLP